MTPKAEIAALVLAMEDFINEPPRIYDIEPMEVRDYRHQAYRVWSPLRDAIMAQKKVALSAANPVPVDAGGVKRQCSVCKAIVAAYPEGMCCHCQELPWPLQPAPTTEGEADHAR